MRVRPLLLLLLALSFGFTLAACSGADDPPRVTTPLECDTGSQCVLTLPSPASFTITLVSRSCDAINNEIRLTSPETVTLTEDACRTEIGTEWNYPTVYPAGTEISLEVSSDQFANPPGLRVTGAYPNWTVSFEDGYDTDFNDIVMSVEAFPSAATLRN